MKLFFKETLRAYLYSAETIYSEQFMYGHRELIVNGLGFSDDTFFKAGIQHGWVSDARLWTNFAAKPSNIRDRYGRKRSYFVWSKLLQSSFLQEYGQRTSVIASPWSILLRAQSKKDRTNARNDSREIKDSILYFPYHSYQGFGVNKFSSLDKITKELNPKKTSTSLYWLDYIDPERREFYSQFSDVTTCGYRGNASSEVPWSNVGGRIMFLLKLMELIESHELIICDDISTAFAAACSLGKKVLVTSPKNGDEKVYSSSNVYRYHEIEKYSMLKRQFGKLKSFKFDEVIDSSLELKEKAQLGFGFDISLAETRELLSNVAVQSLNPELRDPVVILRDKLTI